MGQVAAMDPNEIAEELGPGQIQQHGDPNQWTLIRQRSVPATARGIPNGTLKVYEVWKDAYAKLIEWHYFRYPDGTTSVGKISPYSP